MTMRPLDQTSHLCADGGALLSLPLVGLSAWLLLAPQAAVADTLTVGANQAYGDVANALAAAQAGDTVLVKPGVYQISKLRPPSGVALVGEGGPVQTELHASLGEQAIILDGVQNVRIEGFDIHGEEGLGDPTNALLYIEGSQNVVIRDCFIRDAPKDGDVVKLNSSQDVLIESSVIYNPSERVSSPGTYQENIDIRGSGDARITVRGCWLFHQGARGDYLIYAKGGTTDLLWENNIFGPSAGEGNQNVAVESGHLVNSDPTQYESENFVVRNNLFVALKGAGAFAFAGPKVSLLYNNVFYRNADLLRAVIELSANPSLAGGPGLDLFCVNNIFSQNGERPIYRVRDAATGANLLRDYNLYEPDVDLNDPGSQGDAFTLADEPHSVSAADPLFVSPSVPTFDPQQGTAQIATVLAGFQTQASSPARGAGRSIWEIAASEHPTAVAEMSIRLDAFGNARPGTGPWDVGLFQFVAGGTTDAAPAPNDGGGTEGDGGAPVYEAGTTSPDLSSSADLGATSPSPEDGCSCGVEASSPPVGGWLTFVLTALVLLRRRRRASTSSGPSPSRARGC